MIRKISLDERKAHIQKLCLNSIYSFHSWCENYKNAHSKFNCKCEIHGIWQVSVCNFNAGKRCPKCKHKAQLINIEKREFQISKICKDYGYFFQSWKNDYTGRKSKFICECPIHGAWTTTVDAFVNGGRKCPGCAIYGFNPCKQSTLYALRSECGQHVKIGITNNMERRLKELVKITPFSFSLVESISENGKTIYEFENMFHREFESAKLKGFNGSTEWLKWSPEIQHWLRLLSS